MAVRRTLSFQPTLRPATTGPAAPARGPAAPPIPGGQPAPADRFHADGTLGSADTVNLRGAAAREFKPFVLELQGRQRLDVPEASGVADLGHGVLAVIDDEKGVYLAGHDGSAERARSAKKHKKLKDLEGLCRSPDGRSVYVICEGSGRVSRLAIKGQGAQASLGKPETLGELPMLNDPKLNKGWEGIELMPGKFFADGQDRLLAVNEGKPRRLGLFGLPGLDEQAMLKLPAAALEHAGDLSDLAVCPETGRVLLLSDQSRTILELELVQQQTVAPGALLTDYQLELLAVHELKLKKHEKPEGLDFGLDGKLRLVTDEKAALYTFDVIR